MKIVTNKEGHRFAVATTKKEKIALQKLKYDLFDNYSESLDWNVGNLRDDKTAMRYMFWMYRDWYFNDADVINPELDWRCWNNSDTIEVNYYTSMLGDDEDADPRFQSDAIGTWIPSNYMTLIAYYCMKGKFRKVAMLLKKYGKDSVMPGLHL